MCVCVCACTHTQRCEFGSLQSVISRLNQGTKVVYWRGPQATPIWEAALKCP